MVAKYPKWLWYRGISPMGIIGSSSVICIFFVLLFANIIVPTNKTELIIFFVVWVLVLCSPIVILQQFFKWRYEKREKRTENEYRINRSTIIAIIIMVILLVFSALIKLW